ncbi:MAG: HlyD family secretion protein, partial [Aquificaceae bacterium]|nr:HlyD family secretion protein [Aquificaceae bacterium]MDW8237297.1 HlyD family secretion protein [Aquificaceae bacterium]
FVFLVFFLLFSYKWVRHRMEYAISDAAFVKSDYLASLSFETSGKLIEIYPQLGSEVKSGEVLARLDSEAISLKLKAQESMIESLESQIQKLRLERDRVLLELKSGIEAAGFNFERSKASQDAALRDLESAKISLEQVERELKRAESLFKEGLLPKKQYEQALLEFNLSKKRLESANSSYEAFKAQTSQALSAISELKAKKLIANELDAQIRALEAQKNAMIEELSAIKLELSKTVIKAPFDGIVARKFASVGDNVRAGQAVIALLKKDSMFVEVLLEETSLKGIKVGSKATFRLDAYPDKVFKGEVISISPATAASFAILPRDTSAGEFVKLTQRVPVRIKLKEGPMNLLKLGMGGEVKIKRE